MERRVLGRTGRELSVIGLGGVVFVGMNDSEATEIVSEAIDNGVNYFDVAPSYGAEQETEKRLGAGLEGRRDSVFLACKTAERSRAGAEAELNRSLQHLKTDYFDLYQLHAITTREDVEKAFGPDGAMETFVRAREAGKVRHLGFSAHSIEAALLALEKFSFDSALFPVNFVTFYNGDFGRQIFAKAQEQGFGCLALKAMARTQWKEGADRPFPHCWYEPISDPHFAELALRFTLSQPVTAAIPPGDPRLFRLALQLAQNVRPITDAELAELRAYGQPLEPLFKAA